MPIHERVCAQCGYDLMGLKPKGRCPECGQFYNALTDEGLVTKAAAEERTGFVLRRIRTIVLGLMALLSVSCGAGITFGLLQGNNLRPLVVSGIVAGLFALGAVTSYLYERD